jgi:hypothetical protein
MVNVFVAMPQLIDYFIQLFSKTVQLLLGVATRSKEQQQFGAGAAVGFLLWTGPNSKGRGQGVTIVSYRLHLISYFNISKS